MNMNHLLALGTCSILLCLCSCNDNHNQSIQKVTDQLKDVVTDAADGIQKYTPQVQSLTNDELNKLFSFEYQVVEIPDYNSSKEVERQLQILGRDRWECYAVLPRGDTLQLYLKRRPETYLRYLPRWFP